MANAHNTVEAYYEAWLNGSGDMAEVALSAAFVFDGPMGKMTDRESFQQMASQFAPAAQNFRIREQFYSSDFGGSGARNRVCSIVAWELPPAGDTTTAAEIIRLDDDGAIEKVELIYDPHWVKQFVGSLESP